MSRVGFVLAMLGALAGCADPSPLGGGEGSAEDRALVALVTAFEANDCGAVITAAEGFVASTDLRLRAVETLYGRCLYRQGDDLGASVVLSRVADQPVSDTWVASALYYRGKAYANLGQHAAAAADFTTFGARFPHSALADDARYQLGRAHLALGELEAALADFEAVLALPGASAFRRAGASYRLGLALLDAYADSPAAPELERAYAAFERVLAEFGDSIYADNAAYRRGRVRFAQGRYDDARALFAALPEAYPTSSLLIAARYYEGRCLDEAGDLPGALALYEEVSRREPAGPWADDAAYRRGHALWTLAERAADAGSPDAPALYQTAEEALATALAAFPASVWRASLGYELGRARYVLERFTAAIEAFAVVLERPSSVFLDNAIYYTGRCWYRLAFRDAPESYATAALWFERLLREHPTSPYADDAGYFAGRARYELGELEAAAAAFEGLLTDYPTSSYVDDALRYLVLSHLGRGDCAAAGAALERLAALSPPSPWRASTEAAYAARCGGGAP